MRNKRISIKKVIFYICLLGLIILLVMPILWAMLLSLKTNNEIVNSPLSLPQTISFENYQRAIDTIDFSKMYFNTILLVVISTFFSILFTFMSSFAIARMVFRNHKASETLYLFLLIGIGIPIYVLLFPVYRIDSLMGILGTRLGLILPYVAVNISFNTLLFTGFLRDIPGELEEAAIIDGCNLFKLCTKVVIPVMKPTFVTYPIVVSLAITTCPLSADSSPMIIFRSVVFPEPLIPTMAIFSFSLTWKLISFKTSFVPNAFDIFWHANSMINSSCVFRTNSTSAFYQKAGGLSIIH